jgi:hypothetical protein
MMKMMISTNEMKPSTEATTMPTITLFARPPLLVEVAPEAVAGVEEGEALSLDAALLPTLLAFAWLIWKLPT